MAIRAAALRKPRARVMRALTWAFSASARPFEGPPPRVASMGVLYRDRVLASLVNSGMRHRCAQAVTPRISDLPCVALDLERLADLLLDQVSLVQRLVHDGDLGQGAPLAGVSFRWSLRSAHIPAPRVAASSPRPAARSSAAMRRRSSSSFSPAHLTTWNASRQISRLRGLLADHRVDPARPVGGHVRQRLRPLLAEIPEERLDGGLAASLADPGDPPGVVIGDDDQVLVLPLAPGLLVDPDPAQPPEPVQPGRGVRARPGR